jgi:hypothetical protein
MQPFLWTLLSLVAYIGGLILIVKVTPRLLFRTYDEPWFMGFAVLDILGALLIFGGIVVSLAIFNGALGIKSLDFILLVVVIIITARLALSCFRNYRRGVQPVSRYGAGFFCLFLSLAAIYYIVQLFVA